MQTDQLLAIVIHALEETKAEEIRTLDVEQSSSFTDRMVIATGSSDRHVKSLASSVAQEAKEAGVRALGVEGEDRGEWVLVDLGAVVVHVMLPRVRDFYQLEKLWDDLASGAVDQDALPQRAMSSDSMGPEMLSREAANS